MSSSPDACGILVDEFAGYGAVQGKVVWSVDQSMSSRAGAGEVLIR